MVKMNESRGEDIWFLTKAVLSSRFRSGIPICLIYFSKNLHENTEN